MVDFKCGFVNVIGMPNAGKSSLVNSITGVATSIVTHKPQTTRERVFAIHNIDGYQIIFSDSPGYIENAYYKLHHYMNAQIESQYEDADLFLFVHDSTSDKYLSEAVLAKVRHSKIPKILALNKVDIATEKQIQACRSSFEMLMEFDHVIDVSAKSGQNVNELLELIKIFIPVHPAFYPVDYMSDKPIRFFISELIREQIFILFEDEIPYSTFVKLNSCIGVDDQLDLVKIDAYIIVNKESQKAIIIGKNGEKIKELGIKSRLSIENYLGQKVFLSLTVKFEKNWRDNDAILNKLGIKN
jgi:GTP-binding protein Era